MLDTLWQPPLGRHQAHGPVGQQHRRFSIRHLADARPRQARENGISSISAPKPTKKASRLLHLAV
jgi:hypothetical protein